MLTTAKQIVDGLPHTEVGRCVLAREGTLFAGDAGDLRVALDRGDLIFHSGRIRGAMPELKPPRAEGSGASRVAQEVVFRRSP